MSFDSAVWGCPHTRQSAPLWGISYHVCLDDWKIMERYALTEAGMKEQNSVKLIR
jgi:hypothetical protein